MRRHHNPPYAPEALGRRLNPSGIVAAPVVAEVYVAADDPPPPPEPGDPPVLDPAIPIGPAGPALAATPLFAE